VAVNDWPEIKLCFVFYAQGGKCLRISLARGNPIVVIVNGCYADAQPQLINGLVKLLPMAEYTKIRNDLEHKRFFDSNSIKM
jgi:hypothetical protein